MMESPAQSQTDKNDAAHIAEACGSGIVNRSCDEQQDVGFGGGDDASAVLVQYAAPAPSPSPDADFKKELYRNDNGDNDDAKDMAVSGDGGDVDLHQVQGISAASCSPRATTLSPSLLLTDEGDEVGPLGFFTATNPAPADKKPPSSRQTRLPSALGVGRAAASSASTGQQEQSRDAAKKQS
ncbi:unnamed protein product, partial [Amoebophrya sp. A25]|eukprot:GSA25T00017018001.1